MDIINKIKNYFEYTNCDDVDSFQKELICLINRYSKENDSDTPDFILAEYLRNCLNNYNETMNKRNKWYGEK